ncbi:MAG: alpha/beta fold hydrolase [Alphaproteobacteria bacterium]
MQFFKSADTSIAYQSAGEQTADKPVIIWAHGWGQNHAAFMPLVTSLEHRGFHITLDFPGFGQSPSPDEDWSTRHYADAVAELIKANNFGSVIWVGHSFGCRVGLQMAAHYPELIKGLCLISGAGLKRKRAIHKKIYFYCRIKLFKALRRFVPEGALKDKLMNAFGSADYKSAGAMRKIFVRVVNEDLTPEAEKVACPTALIYGSQDTETPPEFGMRFSRLIKGSKLHLLDGQDHYSVLQNGRHPVIKILNDFIGKICT